MKDFYTYRIKYVKKDGSVSYYDAKKIPVRKEKTLTFEALKNDENVKKILENMSIKKSEKVEQIKLFASNNDDYKKLTLTQIRNFVYRIL